MRESKPFPWDLWLRVNMGCAVLLLLGILIGEPLLLAVSLVSLLIVFDILAFVRWLLGTDFVSRRLSRALKIAMACVAVLLPGLALVARDYKSGESLERPIIVWAVSVLICAGIVAFRSRQHRLRTGNNPEERVWPPDVM